MYKNAYSILFTRPRPQAPVSDYPLQRASSNSTRELSTTRLKLVEGRLSASPCRSSHPMKKKILLVEDDSSLAASLRQVLELSGYQVTVAATGEAGRERAGETRFAAILADFKLPGLNGLELVKQI